MDTELKQVIDKIQEQGHSEPDNCKATLETSSVLGGRFRSDVKIRDHAMTIDEPEAIGGTDRGPTPVEVILAALGSCQEITYRAYAAVLDISIDKISVELEGDIDFRGFFGVDDSIRPGFEQIRARVKLESDAPESEIERLRETVNKHCPVLDILSNKVPVDLDVVVSVKV